MKKFAVIVAGGSGSRMQSLLPKQFLEINGKPIIWFTVQAFLAAFNDIHIILVLPEDHLQMADKIFLQNINITTVKGGETRFHSVKNGLGLIPTNDESVVFIHDGVRCCISKELIVRCFEQAKERGTAVPAVASQDSVRIVDAETSHVFDRQKIMLIQTPQTFLSSIILPAFNCEYNESFTDEATVVETVGIKINLIEGEYSNLKVTRPLDLLIAEQLLNAGKKL